MATQFVFDTFIEAADTLLSAHTPDVGGAWVRNTAYATEATVLAAEDKVRGGSTSLSSVYTNSATPPSSDYEVRATSRIITADSARCGVVARASTTVDTGYFLLYSGAQWELSRRNAGVGVLLGSYNGSEALNTDYEVRLVVFKGQLSVYIAGVLRIDVLDSTPITDVGFAGVITRLNDRLDNFQALTLDSVDARLYQGLAEVLSFPSSPDARLYQGLAEVLSFPSSPDARLYQSVTEVITSIVSEARLEQALVEVLSRELTLDSQATIDSIGTADLRQGLPLEIEIEIDFIGVAQLDIGSTLYLGSPPHTVEAELEGRVQTRAALAGEAQIAITGVADFNYGTEIRQTISNLSLKMVGSLRVGMQPDNLSNFFLVF